MTCDRSFAILYVYVNERSHYLYEGKISMAKDTKSRLLDAALEMFSQNGYAGTNIRELAASLGLGKSSLYRHFESKDEIWNAMLDDMEAYYEEQFGSENDLPTIPQNAEELKELTLMMLDFTIKDKKVIMTRRILLTEQFRDERVRQLATKHFNTSIEALYTKIFAGMMENGSLKKDDPAMLAFEYTSSISTLVQLCDREAEQQAEIMEKIKAYIDHFVSVYGEVEESPKKYTDYIPKLLPWLCAALMLPMLFVKGSQIKK